MHLKKFIKENLVLAAGIGLPLLLVAIFLLCSAIPRWMTPPPKYDLLLMSHNWNLMEPRTADFYIEHGKLKARPSPKSKDNPSRPRQRLFIYNVASQSYTELQPVIIPPGAREVTVAETQNLILSTSTKAPDDYVFDGQQYASHMPPMDLMSIGHRAPRGYRLKKGAAVYWIDSAITNDLTFLGWITDKKNAE